MFATIQAKIIAAGVVLVLIGGAIWYIYHKGESAGSSEISAKVNATTVKTIDAARIDKEKTNEKVRSTPLDAVIDGLR